MSEQTALEIPRTPPRSPLEEPCPRCGARSGEPCETSTGEVTSYTHKVRRRLATFRRVDR